MSDDSETYTGTIEGIHVTKQSGKALGWYLLQDSHSASLGRYTSVRIRDGNLIDATNL